MSKPLLSTIFDSFLGTIYLLLAINGSFCKGICGFDSFFLSIKKGKVDCLDYRMYFPKKAPMV